MMICDTKKYKVTIFGESYVLVSDEPEGRLSRSTALVDALMQDIAQQSGITDVKKLAVLAALQVASTLARLEAHLDDDLAI